MLKMISRKQYYYPPKEETLKEQILTALGNDNNLVDSSLKVISIFTKILYKKNHKNSNCAMCA